MLTVCSLLALMLGRLRLRVKSAQTLYPFVYDCVLESQREAVKWDTPDCWDMWLHHRDRCKESFNSLLSMLRDDSGRPLNGDEPLEDPVLNVPCCRTYVFADK